MQISLIVAACLHVLSVAGWAGLTFAMARTAAAQLEQLFVPQMGAAVTAMLSGGWFGYLTHRGAFGRSELLLAFGVVFALTAFAIQAVTVSMALRVLPRPASLGGRVVIGQRISAGVLALTLIVMAAARYV
jgi:hypothetical protein